MKLLISGKRPRLKEIKDPSKYARVGTSKGKPVYARRVRVESDSGKTVRRALSYKRKQGYVYHADTKRYVEVSASKAVEIQTNEGPKRVTTEQLKYKYKREGKGYRQMESVAKYKKEDIHRKLPPMTQLAVKVKFMIDGKPYIVEGYSRFNNLQSYTYRQSLKQAINTAKYYLLHDYPELSYEDVNRAEVKVMHTENVRWVT